MAKRYVVTAPITVTAGVIVEAESLGEALAKAKELDVGSIASCGNSRGWSSDEWLIDELDGVPNIYEATAREVGRE